MHRPPPEPPAGPPGFLRWRHWLPGVLLAGTVGPILVVLSAHLGVFGYGVVLGVPFAIGSALGYGLAVPTALRVCFGLLLLGVLAVGAITADMAGLLCVLILAGLFVGPLLVGVGLGYHLRRRLNSRGSRRGRFLPVVFLVSPASLMLAETRAVSPAPIESIYTERTVALSPAEAWNRIAFYEEVPLRPPLLARIGLPHPLYTEGSLTGVGAVKRCVYDTGYLVKRITRFDPRALLAFDVIEQRGIEDRSIELIDGSFALAPNPDGTTTITLTTRYRPLLAARSAWRPFEIALARTLHHHVLDGITSRR